MIFNKAIARRYAQGFFSNISKEDNITPEYLLDLVNIFKDENLTMIFSDPRFSIEERKAVVKKLCQSLSLHEMLSNFLLLLVEKQRIQLLPEIVMSLRHLIDESLATKRALIKSAKALEKKETDDITKILGNIFNKKIIVDTEIDESLLGGIHIEIAGTIFDGSVKGKLFALKNKLVPMK